jgi:hypothetical protein
MATKGHPKFAQNHYFAGFFSHLFQGAATSQKLKLKIFLAMRRTAAPFKPPNRRDHISLLAIAWCLLWLKAAPKYWSLFKQHFSNKNKCKGP